MNEMFRRPGFISLLAILNFSGGILVFAFVGLIAWQDEFLKALHILIGYGAIGILLVLCSYGLWNLKNYGRWIQIAFCYLGILAVPFGTVLSIIILIQLHKQGYKLLFSRKNAEELTPEEFQVLTNTCQKRYTKMNTGIIVLVLAEILVVIAAIAVPDVIISFDKIKQRRTMTDLRTIASGLGAYAVDHNDTYPNANSFEELIPVLKPLMSSAEISAKDAWGHELRYVVWREDPSSAGPDSYIIASPGKDGIWENQDLRTYTQGRMSSYNDDILIKNGQFLRSP